MITSASAGICCSCSCAEYTCHGSHNIFALLAARNARRKSTGRCRIEVTCGECHVAENFAGVGSGIGKNVTFTVGNTVFCRINEKRYRSFNFDKREKTEGYIKALCTHIGGDGSAATALAEIFGYLVNGAAAGAAAVVSVCKLY